MAVKDRALTRLEQAVKRLEHALDKTLQTIGDASLSQLESENQRLSEELDSAVARNRELEGRLETADAKLGSVVAQLKTMLERGDAPSDGTDQQS